MTERVYPCVIRNWGVNKARIDVVKFVHLLALMGMALLLLNVGGCQNNNSFARVKDSGPSHDVDVSQIENAVPRVDPITIAGNKNPYTINGITYQLLPAAKGYSEEGEASWYGTKFHGRKTSNGETYDMYGMTAAHKTLPIPAYVRVTNLANQRQIIVRVNDRGPFHGGRIIDLSYAGAKKLGYANAGTARVRVEVIDPANFQTNSVSLPSLSAQVERSKKTQSFGVIASERHVEPFLQVGVYRSAHSAQQLQARLALITSFPVSVRRFEAVKSPIYKVWIGPIVDQLELAALRDRLIAEGKYKPFVVNAVRDI